jgi:hypothetical protein
MAWSPVAFVQESMMEFYTGIFLVTLGIGYLLHRFAQRRSVNRIHVKTDNGPGSQNTRRKLQKHSPRSASAGSRRNAVGRTLNRSGLVATTVPKPWGW